ncbi:MAG: hypothetical protein GXP31_01060 [Kiritimatiellaeota bacterium]|nr:hypothetical protein [Kiritimatiellota bacterium]
MSTRLIFSFDSEDYETPSADAAEKWWAEAMSRHGFTACACVVGELARALRARGRRDVIRAMSRHEIAFHSNMHSAHPTWAEYLDVLDWESGVRRALEEEGRGIADVRETFGQQPSAWCKPGASWGPQIAEAMRRLDVPVFADSPFEWASGQPLWFANALFLTYHTSFDRYFSVVPSQRLEQMKEDFLELCDRHAGTYLIMYTHPCRLVTASFPQNFTAGANPPRTQWRPAPCRDRAEIAQLQGDFDAFLDYVARLPNIEPTTYRKLYREFAPGPVSWLDPVQIRRLIDKPDDAPLACTVLPGGTVLSPAEEFGVLLKSAVEFAGAGRMPNRVAVERLLGPLHDPVAAASGDAPSQAVLDACLAADAECRTTGAVPAEIVVGAAAVGPHALMKAVRRLLRSSQTGGAPSRTIAVRPAGELPEFAKRREVRDYRFQNTWSVFPPDFLGCQVMAAIRRQSWTAKPAIRADSRR